MLIKLENQLVKYLELKLKNFLENPELTLTIYLDIEGTSNNTMSDSLMKWLKQMNKHIKMHLDRDNSPK